MITKVLTMLVLEAAFIYFRTVNINHVASNNMVKAIFSGNLLGLLYLITTALGVEAALNINEGWPVVLAYFLGGTIGLIAGFKLKF